MEEQSDGWRGLHRRLMKGLCRWQLVWVVLAVLFLGVLLQASDHLRDVARAHTVMAQLQYEGYQYERAAQAEVQRIWEAQQAQAIRRQEQSQQEAQQTAAVDDDAPALPVIPHEAVDREADDHAP